MTSELTDADHDAVDWLYEMGVIAPHHLRLANEALARHREAVRAEQAAEIARLREALEEATEEIIRRCYVVGVGAKDTNYILKALFPTNFKDQDNG